MTTTRRRVLQGALATAAVPALTGLAIPMNSGPAAAARAPVMTRRIPSSGEAVAMVGLGSWITFNVGRDPQLLAQSAAVIDAFLAGGGQMIDSSPMYGSAQATIGHALARRGGNAGLTSAQLFSADKVWISDSSSGPAQIEASRANWGVPRFDLLQVHNLVAWEGHLETLFAMKAEKKLRYAGVTTSHGRRHRDLEAIMTSQPLDFVQLTYNAQDREAEARLLPLAREKGIAVIVNRPFQRGGLVRAMEGKAVPPWAGEVGATNWPQLLLKFVLAHPGVTCAIPATTQVAHVEENLAAATVLPDASMREKIAALVAES